MGDKTLTSLLLRPAVVREVLHSETLHSGDEPAAHIVVTASPCKAVSVSVSRWP